MSSPQQAPTTATPGSWVSPMSVAEVVAGGATMTELSSDGADLLWLESLPEQDGRVTVMRLHDGQTTELTPAPATVRSRVNEYGGGAYSCVAGVLAYCDDSDATVKLRTPDGTVRPMTAGDPLVRHGDLRVHPEIPLVLAIREDHHQPGEAQTTIVAIEYPASDGTLGREHVLRSGASFYANPELASDGRLAFIEWNHPAMPWDASVLKVGRLRLGDTPALTDVQVIAGMEHAGLDGVAVQHPRWATDGSLVFTSDASGYQLLSAWQAGQVQSLHADSADFDLPTWTLGNQAHAELDPGRILTWSCTDGQGQLSVVSTTGQSTRRLAGVSLVDSVCVCLGEGFAIVDRPAQQRALVRVAPDGRLETVRAVGPEPDRDQVSIARSLLFNGRHGPVQAWYYPPTNSDFRVPPGIRPPLLLRVHGGPTALATNGYNPAVQFWTTRGFAVLDVNYSGSAGFGRRWRNRLRGMWGVADADDCIDAAEAVIDAGLADPGRIAIAGGSAGGFTALRALTTSRRFSAGISRYGVADLIALLDTHKFESHYLDSLIGPYPASEQLYRTRSPINNLDQLASPILILQGSEDAVVPLSQSQSLAQAARDRKLPMAMLVFAGEGHGFRGKAAREQALAAEFSFLAQLFGFTPAGDLPRIQIENLPVA